MIKNKQVLLITFIVILFTINISKVYATPTYGGGYGRSFGGGSPGSGDGPASPGTFLSCNPTGRFDIRNDVTADIYGKDDKFISDISKLENTKFTSGMFVGLDIYEDYTHIITVTVNPTWSQYQRKCYKEAEYDWVLVCSQAANQSIIDSAKVDTLEKRGNSTYSVEKMRLVIDDPGTDPICNWQKRQTSPSDTQYSDDDCPAGYQDQGVELRRSWSDYSYATVKGCLDKNMPTDSDFKATPSFSVKYYNSNDATKQNENVTKIDGNIVKVPGGPVYDIPNRKVTRKFTYKINYNLSKACINVKTAEIFYDNKCSSGNNDLLDIQLVTNRFPEENTLVGKYFIPLNTTTGTITAFSLDPNMDDGSIKEKELCLDIIDNYPSSWRNYLRTIAGEKFLSVTKTSAARSKITRDGGCRFGLIGEVDAEQKFYGETKNKDGTISLIGYRFYYQAIDPKEPFLNGIANDSLWYGLYNSDENAIKVTNKNNKTTVTKLSFGSKSYVTEQLSSGSVATMNSSLYTSWDAMNKDGTSNNIGTGIIQRLTKLTEDPVYNLGCGPSNSDWKECNKK